VPHTPTEQADAWVEKATALADAYVRKFMKTSQTAVRAREGGYEAALKEYVRAVSWVQAQMIGGRQGIAYDSGVLFGGDLPRDREAEEAFFAKAREQAAKGSIRAHVPAAMVRQWAEEVQGQGRKL